VLFEDGLFAEYAILTLNELRAGSFPPGRLVWARADAPPGIERCGRPREASPYDYPEYHINEAVTNLYVGLRNKEAALAILEWIEEREEVPAVLANEIRRLAVRP
jgi:hypothetical protein